MMPRKEGFRVAVVGASSLLGKELVSVLEQGRLPVSRLLTLETDEGEPDLPIVDLGDTAAVSVPEADIRAEELDFAFLSGSMRSLPAFLSSWGEPGNGARCHVIDVGGEGLAGSGPAPGGEACAQAPVAIPFLDQRFPREELPEGLPRLYVSAHAAVMVISGLLLRLAAHIPLKTAVAQAFISASECGARGIEELQNQTVSLLSFQKVPRKVFGAQLAFNLLSRPGRAASLRTAGLEERLRRQLHYYLGDRVPRPALRLFQVPVFFSLGVSLYVETATPVPPDAAAAALASERIKVRRTAQDAPTLVEVTGTSDILVDSVLPDPGQAAGLWLWAVADNLHLAATNAVELAATLAHDSEVRGRRGAEPAP